MSRQGLAGRRGNMLYISDFWDNEPLTRPKAGRSGPPIRRMIAGLSRRITTAEKLSFDIAVIQLKVLRQASNAPNAGLFANWALDSNAYAI